MAAPLRVLVVDDDDAVRDVVALSLASAEVVEASNAVQALALMQQHRFDAAVIDVMMPGVDGFELLARIRRGEQADMAIVMLTAKTGERDHLVAFQGGADAYVTKPFDVAALADTLEAIVARTPTERVARRSGELARAELLRQVERGFGI